MSCTFHANILGKLTTPFAFSKVFKDECTLCFVTPENKDGLDVCLSCFNGSCHEHSIRHFKNSAHSLVLNVKKNLKESQEKPSKVQKVEILPDRELDYDFQYRVKCLACAMDWEIGDPEIKDSFATVKALITSVSAKKRIDVQAWQEEAVPCEHSRDLKQEVNPVTLRLQSREKCGDCEFSENLWMCLTCGSIGCGRRQYDGSGGNSHGASHFEQTKHALAVKLGTITPDGNGDVNCYICGEMRADPKLADHLSTLGMDVSGVEKTERTMAELQLEQNLKFDFSMVTDDGRQLESVSGSGMTGLKNLGNSCYIASTLQSLFLLPEFKKSYFEEGGKHVDSCRKDPASCFQCQAVKIASGLWNGEETCIAPWMFKAVVASGHPEFSTGKQQDASEFLSYLLKVIQRNDPNASTSIVDSFSFMQQQELICDFCADVRCQKSKAMQLPLQVSDVLTDDTTITDTVHLTKFLDSYFANETLDAKCNKCGANEKTKKIAITSYPKYLLLPISRYILRNWVPQKIDLSVEIPFEGLDLSSYLGEEKASDSNSNEEKPTPDAAVLDELMGMGFPLVKCKKAIQETGNVGIEAAMNWIFEHEEDVIEESNITSDIPDELVSLLVDAGFTKEKATVALRETDGDIDRAFDWILSHPEDESNQLITTNDKNVSSSVYDLVAFISHKGPSVHCGHYIAHVRHPETGQWIMFNDERVALCDPQPPVTASEKAYIYLYRSR